MTKKLLVHTPPTDAQNVRDEAILINRTRFDVPLVLYELKRNMTPVRDRRTRDPI